MAGQTLLVMVQRCARSLGIPVPTAVTSSTDEQVLQLLEFFNDIGAFIYDARESANPWPELKTEHTFSTVVSQSDYTLPAGFNSMVNDTFYNTTTRQPVGYPVTLEEWQVLSKSIVSGGVLLNYAMHLDGTLRIYPTPSSIQAYSFWYNSKYWAKSSGGTPKTVFTADDDQFRLDDDLLRLGVLYRWRRSKGLDYGEEAMRFDDKLNKEKSKSTGSGRIALTTGTGVFGVPYAGGITVV